MAEKSGIVFVGNKMPMDYVLAIITGLSASDAKKITLKARGKAITTAVDAAEITRNRFLKDLKVSKIAIGTEEMPPRERTRRTWDSIPSACRVSSLKHVNKPRHSGLVRATRTGGSRGCEDGASGSRERLVPARLAGQFCMALIPRRSRGSCRGARYNVTQPESPFFVTSPRKAARENQEGRSCSAASAFLSLAAYSPHLAGWRGRSCVKAYFTLFTASSAASFTFSAT